MSPIANPDGTPIGRRGQVEPGQAQPVRPVEVRAGQVGNENRPPQYTEAQRQQMQKERAQLNQEQAAIKQRIEQHNEQPGDQKRFQEMGVQLNDLNLALGRDSAQRIDQARAEAPRPAAQTPAAEAAAQPARTEGTVSPNAPDAEFAHTVQSGLKMAEQAVAEDAAREDLLKTVESGRKMAEQAKQDDELRKIKESGQKLAEWARQDDANREQIFTDMNREPTQEEVDVVAHRIWENRVAKNIPGDALADQDAARKQIAREREEAKKKHLESRPPGSPQPAEKPKDTSTERSGGGGGGGGGAGRVNAASAESLIDAIAAEAGVPADANTETGQPATAEQKNGNETAEVAALKQEVAELKKMLAEQRQQMQEMATLIAALAEKNGIDKNKLGQLAKGLGLMSILALLGVTVSGMSRGMGGR